MASRRATTVACLIAFLLGPSASSDELAEQSPTPETVLKQLLGTTGPWTEVEIEFWEIRRDEAFDKEEHFLGHFTWTGPRSARFTSTPLIREDGRWKTGPAVDLECVWSEVGLQVKCGSEPAESCTWNQIKAARARLDAAQGKVSGFWHIMGPALAAAWHGLHLSPRDCFPLLLAAGSGDVDAQFEHLHTCQSEDYVFLHANPNASLLLHRGKTMAIVLDRESHVPVGTKTFIESSDSITRLFTSLKVNGRDITVPLPTADEAKE